VGDNSLRCVWLQQEAKTFLLAAGTAFLAACTPTVGEAPYHRFAKDEQSDDKLTCAEETDCHAFFADWDKAIEVVKDGFDPYKLDDTGGKGFAEIDLSATTKTQLSEVFHTEKTTEQPRLSGEQESNLRRFHACVADLYAEALGPTKRGAGSFQELQDRYASGTFLKPFAMILQTINAPAWHGLETMVFRGTIALKKGTEFCNAQISWADLLQGSVSLCGNSLVQSDEERIRQTPGLVLSLFAGMYQVNAPKLEKLEEHLKDSPNKQTPTWGVHRSPEEREILALRFHGEKFLSAPDSEGATVIWPEDEEN